MTEGQLILIAGFGSFIATGAVKLLNREPLPRGMIHLVNVLCIGAIVLGGYMLAGGPAWQLGVVFAAAWGFSQGLWAKVGKWAREMPADVDALAYNNSDEEA